MSGKSKILKKIVIIALCAVAFVLVVAIGGFAVLSFKDGNPDRPESIENKTGFVVAEGRNLYDGDGKLVTLEGVNFGNWFDQEYWMAASTVGDFDTGLYTPKRAEAAMKQNPNLTDEQIESVKALYIDEFIKEGDFSEVASLGLNCIRINFTYLNVTTDGYILREDAFDKLDWAVAMAEKYGLYVIIDYHGAVGSQNMDNHSGVDDEFNLYGNRKNMDATIELWKAVATRYRDNKTVAAYDLLNEPRRAPGKYAGKAQFDFYDELYQAVRAIDENHLIIMECFTFPTHGVHPKKYGWKNVAYSYHFYNLTPFSQSFALNFYKVLDNLKGYDVPIIVGEFSAWSVREDWLASFDFFEKQGWSYLSWTYKTNKYGYYDGKFINRCDMWGFYELLFDPVDLSTATYDEIVEVYSAVGTENAEKSMIYNVYKSRLGD